MQRFAHVLAVLPALAILSPFACSQGIRVDWHPTACEVVLNTDIPRIVTSAGPMTIRGGVSFFRNVTIPAGTRVRGQGTRPQIDIEVHGETYANNSHDFSISADGGVGLLASIGGGGGGGGKYPPTTAGNMDAHPAGGMGGMGLIQLMARPGTNSDGTNTLLDDNIVLRKGTTVLTGATKQRYLAWRGFPTAAGGWVDDAGRETAIGDKAGDFRPNPILLPVF